MTEGQQAREAKQDGKQNDEQNIRALIDTWAQATHAGDLTAQMNLMTEDVVFLTAGNMPMRREDYAAGWISVDKSTDYAAMRHAVTGEVPVRSRGIFADSCRSRTKRPSPSFQAQP